MMSDEDFTGAGRADMANLAPGKHRGPRFSWNPAYEETFFDSLCESVRMGLREGTIFKAEAWDRAIQAINEKHNAYPNKSHLINKSDNARKKFRLWRGLREDSDFVYNATTKTVEASEEAWRRHIEREPLSRSLKGRPFEHEQYYEVLFSDVVGSRGAPKRVTKTRRKTDSMPTDDQDTQNTTMMDLLADVTFDPNVGVPPPPRSLQVASNMHTMSMAPMSVPIPTPVAMPVQPRPAPTTMPPRASVASTSALTPPEEHAPHSKKRFMPSDVVPSNNVTGAAASPNKRQRNSTAHKDPSTNTMSNPNIASLSSSTIAPAHKPPSANTSQTAPATTGAAPATAHVEALRPPKSQPQPAGWVEQALDIFFREFNDQEMDLQIKIAEKVLTDDNKALVFCKMPVALRRHWIKRLREAYNRSDNRNV